MIRYKNLFLVGTSHISKKSVDDVEKTILNVKPRFIALELDKRRFNLLNLKKGRIKFRIKDLKELGFKAYLLNLIGAWLEKKMSKKIGTEPGDEMRKVVDIARKLKIELLLIDQDIKDTLNKLVSRISFREKILFIKELILGKKEIEFNIKKKTSQRYINKIVNVIKRDYPSFYLTIIKERNEYMANKIYQVIRKYPKDKVVGVVGAGHEK